MIDTGEIPHEPGCYLYKDKRGRIIYIGKAGDLKKRVSSYFTKNNHDAKTEQLVSVIDSVDFIVTENETEALVLESNLIKKHQPKYNVNLKDSKRYAYLQLTDEEYPRLLLARKRDNKGRFFGPFVSAAEREYVRNLVIKTFHIRTCKRLPKKPCLRFHIKLCKAPCVGLVSKESYNSEIAIAQMVLRGRVKELIKKLETKMQRFSEGQLYEHAMEAREQINALIYLNERQNMERQKKYDEDVINFVVRDDVVYLSLFNVHRGMLHNKQEYIFDATPEFLNDFLMQYYDEHDIPKELILPKKIDTVLHSYLERKLGQRLRINVPQKGEKKQLLTLVSKNIDMSFFGDLEKVQALQKAVKLQDPPEVIECFDISHISGSATAGSMVQFRNGKPDKSNYRRFRIETVDGVDDFKALQEVVRRRYVRLKKENAPFPDLIVIDGGKGQLSACMQILTKLELKIPMISLAKRFEEIYFPGLSIPLRLDKKGVALRYLQQIRDEAHRFAIKYNRLLRSKELLK